MGLIENNSKTRIFLGISHGKITRRVPGEEAYQQYEAFEGNLRKVEERLADLPGAGKVRFVDFTFAEGDVDYVLSVQLSSSILRSIIFSLASIQDFKGNLIRINPYLSRDGQYTNISVYNNGAQVKWAIEAKQIPPVKVVQLGTTEAKDDADRVEFVRNYIKLVQQRLAAGSADEAPAAPDMPEAGIPSEEDMPDMGAGYGPGFFGEPEHI